MTQAIDVVFSGPEPIIVDASLAGAPGPPGPPGGTGAMAYRHVQMTASTSWVINHGLSFFPNVSAVDSAGEEIHPGIVDYTSSTVVTLTFSAAVGGEAYLS